MRESAVASDWLKMRKRRKRKTKAITRLLGSRPKTALTLNVNINCTYFEGPVRLLIRASDVHVDVLPQSLMTIVSNVTVAW